MQKSIFGVLLACALGGCATVTSDEPLFAQQDAAGAPVLRNGVWAMPGATECDFDPKAPAKTWPKCANATVVGPSVLTNAATAGETPQSISYVLAGADPTVLQLMRPDGDMSGPAVIYAGLRATAFDEARRATAVRVWLALCAKPATAGGHPTAAPTTVLPGLTLRPGGGQDCVAKAQEPVRNAVKQSEAWLTQGDDKDFALSAHWVRDGAD